MISSAGNAQIKRITALQKKSKLREEEHVFVIEGRKLFDEVVQQSKEIIEKVFISESYLASLGHEEKELYGLPLEVVSDSVFKEISETVTPQGILAVVAMPEYTLEEILSHNNVKLLILENLRDPGNLGTMMRTAEAAGFDGILLSKESVDMYNPKVIRSTMGAIFRMPFFYFTDFRDMIIRLKESGVTLYATHLQGAVSYTDVFYEKKTAIMIGNESKGLSDQTTKLSDYRIKIPMDGQVESLNAAVAAAIVLFEVKRQTTK